MQLWKVITSHAMQWLLYILLGNARKNCDGIVSKSIVYFTQHPVNTAGLNTPEPLKLRKILDMVIRLTQFIATKTTIKTRILSMNVFINQSMTMPSCVKNMKDYTGWVSI